MLKRPSVKLVVRGMLAVSLLLVCSLWLMSALYYHVQQPLQFSEEQSQLVIEVEKGSSLSRVNRQLYDAGVLPHPKLLSLFARLNGQTAIQAGQYRIEAGESALQLLNKFNRGDVLKYQITFPEGWSYRQWLAQLTGIEQFSDIRQLNDAQIMVAAGIDQANPEGWLFPDTYTYVSSDSAIDILARAHRKMVQVLDQTWQQRAPNLPYQSPYEALIMASIIEKETGLAEERPAIAGVFVRRLQRGMRLQTDPTVIYGLGDDYQGNITRAHLKSVTPYNTYRINGLPPTPIAMPSAAAIEAALHPQSGDELYFVARGDGGHYFSKSLDEHQKAVRQYQINQRAPNYQSAPKAQNQQ
jgi:UPF0755 protein